MLALAVVAGPLEDMQSLAEFRSPLLTSLGDLKLSDEEALNQISSRINEVLEIPNDAQNKDFWIDMITKKRTFAPKQATTDSILEALKAQVEEECGKLFAATQALVQKQEANWGEKEINEVLGGFRAVANSVAAKMTEMVVNDARAQFAHAVDSAVIDKELKIKQGVATELANLLIEKMNEFNEAFEDVDLGIDEDFSNEIQGVLSASIKLTNPLSHSLGQVLSLMTNGAYMLRIEARFMFAAIQHYTEVPAKDRLSRMLVIARLLVLFGQLNNKLEEVNDLSNTIFAFRQAIIKGDAQEDANFAPLFRAFTRDYITIINQQISTEASFTMGKRLLTISQELVQSHLTEFVKARVAEHSLPHLSLAELPQNSKDYLEVINAITALDFADVTAPWWNEVLLGYDRLLAVDPNVINTAGYASILLSSSITPVEGHLEFLNALYALLLEFLELNGSQLSPENYGVYFDQYINSAAQQSPLIQKYYLQLKVHNIYCIPATKTFDVVFNNFAATADEAKALGQALSAGNFERVDKMLFNAYARHTGDKKASSKNSFLYIQKLSGATVPSDKFNHGNFGFTVKESAKQKRKEEGIVTVHIKFSDAKPEGAIVKKEKTPAKSPNKIVIDQGEEENLPDPGELKLVRTDGNDHYSYSSHGSPVKEEESPQELPSIQRQPSLIPNKELETLVQQQIEQKEAEEKVESQITQILEPKNPVTEADSKTAQQQEPEADLNELQGDLTDTEKKVLLQKNLKEVLGQLSEITDADGNTTKFVYVKLIPKKSDCYHTLFS